MRTLSTVRTVRHYTYQVYPLVCRFYATDTSAGKIRQAYWSDANRHRRRGGRDLLSFRWSDGSVRKRLWSIGACLCRDIVRDYRARSWAGFFTGAKWAWIAGIIIYVISIGLGIAEVLYGGSVGGVGGIIRVLAGLVIPIYLTRKGPKAFFGKQPSSLFQSPFCTEQTFLFV